MFFGAKGNMKGAFSDRCELQGFKRLLPKLKANSFAGLNLPIFVSQEGGKAS